MGVGDLQCTIDRQQGCLQAHQEFSTQTNSKQGQYPHAYWHLNGMGKHKRAKQDPLNNCSTGSPDAQSLDVKMNDITDGSVQNQAKGQRGRWSINPKKTKPAKLTNSNYYPLLWMKLLDCAKAWMHQHVAIDNAFSALLDAITGPCQEALLKTIAYYEDNGLEVKAGMPLIMLHAHTSRHLIDIYPVHKEDMSRLVSLLFNYKDSINTF